MDKERKKQLKKKFLEVQEAQQTRASYIPPREEAKQFVKENFGEVTYEELGENESLGGLIATKNQVLTIRTLEQTYEFGGYGRPIFNPQKASISVLSESKPLPKDEQIKCRRNYIELAKIGSRQIKDFSGVLGEWGANPRAEPTTKQIREIFEICKYSDIPIWFSDSLECVLKWGVRDYGIEPWLRKNYSKYIGLPLYKIPPIDFSQVDLSNFPKIEKEIIESGKLNCCQNYAGQMTSLLWEACQIFGLNPIIIDQKKLRDSGAFRKGIDKILANKEKLEKRFGSLFRVECPKCGKYIFNVEIKSGKVLGICDGRVRSQRGKKSNLEDAVRYEGCGSILEEEISYIYTNAVPGKMLTSIYIANSDVGVFFPDKEFVSGRIYTGAFSDQVQTTGDTFNSGIPEIIQIGDFTSDGNVENIFRLLDYMPAKDVKKRLGICPVPERRINVNKKSIEPLLVNKLKSFNPPADPRLIADVLYSLGAERIDMARLGWSLEGAEPYVTELLRCLGNVRENRVLERSPQINWTENYQEFMNDKFISEEEIKRLKENMINKNSKVRTIIETTYLGSLSN